MFFGGGLDQRTPIAIQDSVSDVTEKLPECGRGVVIALSVLINILILRLKFAIKLVPL